MTGFFEPVKNSLTELPVFFRMGTVKTVKLNSKTVKIPYVFGLHPLDELLRSNTLLPGADHDRRTVCIVGATINTIVTAHLLKADPDIRLDIFHQMADMD